MLHNCRGCEMKKRKPKPRHFLTEQVISQCIDLRAYGFTWMQCEEMLGEKMHSLRAALMRAGVPMLGVKGRLVKATPELVLKARELRAQGMCWKLVERELGVNWLTLAYHVYAEDKAARDGQ